jgi:hypothetical protein
MLVATTSDVGHAGLVVSRGLLGRAGTGAQNGILAGKGGNDSIRVVVAALRGWGHDLEHVVRFAGYDPRFRGCC